MGCHCPMTFIVAEFRGHGAPRPLRRWHAIHPAPASRRSVAQSIMSMLENRYGGVVVKFKPLLDRWKKEAAPPRTAKEYAVRLPLDDAARLHALVELFPGGAIEGIITVLLPASRDEIAAAMPYERGPKIISLDDQGDPL